MKQTTELVRAQVDAPVSDGHPAQPVCIPRQHRIVPPPPRHSPEDDESLDAWGFRDSEFRVTERGTVEMTGARYPLCGSELPELLPWISRVLSVDLDGSDLCPSRYPTTIPEARVNTAFLDDIRSFLAADQICQEPTERLRHGHGHTQDEIYAIKLGVLGRIPDLVVYPTEEPHVSALVATALRHDVSVIPFGGGTCVTEALRCPQEESRTIVSVDMRRMNRILWIDPVDRMACIEAGAVGRDIAAQLAEYGFTMGHEPDSIEFSTLGGWIATHASGMKQNRYGNIEDLILDMRVVTASGLLERPTVVPRESVGCDPRQWMFGSEGGLGIVTSAVMKLFPLPELQRYGCVVFPDFERGVAFLYDLMQEATPPASVRLMDNLQFQFSVALKSHSEGLKALKGKIEKFFVTRVKGFDPERMAACTLAFEGSRREVNRQEAAVSAIASRHGGLKAGAENGRRGYLLTFNIAYLRDFGLRLYLLGESFETSVPWSQLLPLCENVKKRVNEECRRRNLPGRPFVTCRITQIYETGVCVYFYFAFYFKGVERPSEVYAEIETAAREEILRNGGSLSHHHGVGKLREKFLPSIKSAATLEWIERAKRALDPTNVFGCGNQRMH